MQYPPAEVDVLSQEIVSFNQFPTTVFILANGKTENRAYDVNILYAFDIEKEEFVNFYPLGMDATEIAANGEYLFVYSKEEGAVYTFEVLGKPDD